MSSPTPITHIVLFRYRSTIPWSDLEQHFRDFAALKSTCLKPAHNGRPYMLSMTMGKNHSWENYSKGMTHAFILEFGSVEDRDFYLLEDPVHRAFSVKAGPLIEDSVVVDIQDRALFAGFPSNTQKSATKTYGGSCHCNAINFQITTPIGSPPNHVICHCDTCKKLSGAPYSCNYIVSRDDLTVTKGSSDLKVYDYTGASGKSVHCYYCGNCTSHIYHVQQLDPSKAIVRTLLLDSGKVMGVGGEIFKEGALGWVGSLRDALPA